MGDILHTLPAVTDASRSMPDIKFDWVVEESFSEIPSWHRAVDQVIPVAMRRWRRQPLRHLFGREWRAFRTRLRATRYEAVIDAQGLIKSAVTSRLVSATRFGLDRQSAREGVAAWAYDHAIAVPKNMHAVERLRELFALSLGYPVPHSYGTYAIDQLIRKQAAPSLPGLVFCHGSSRKEKLWPVRSWIALAKLAAGSGLHVYLPWGDDNEQARAERIAAGSSNVTVLTRQSLDELAVLLGNSMGVVAVDTGLGHLSAALSVPTVSLYGPTNPSMVGAYGQYQVHIESPRSGAVGFDAKALMHSIPAESVWRELQSVMHSARTT